MKLTMMEKQILNGMRNNCFSDILESDGDWVFAVIDQANIEEKKARGVISSLVKKGLVEVWDNDGQNCMNFTNEGKKLFDNATGPEGSWNEIRILSLKRDFV